MNETQRTGSEAYYERRARWFDAVYEIPERQDELREVAERLRQIFDGCAVLEVAAGTGYWTQFFADDARTVVATDVNDAVLDIARQRRAWPETVSFRRANCFDLTTVDGRFDAAFVGFLWSHVLVNQLPELLVQLADRLEPGSRIVFIDSRYLEGSNTPETRTDEAGNHYQTRTLDDGSTWDVVKNFPSTDEVRERLSTISDDIAVTELEYFWLADLRTR